MNLRKQEKATVCEPRTVGGRSTKQSGKKRTVEICGHVLVPPFPWQKTPKKPETNLPMQRNCHRCSVADRQLLKH